MAANKGWICLYRDIQDNWVWENDKDEQFSRGQAWVDMLLTANHEDRKILLNGKLVTIQRGQFHTSIVKLADRWNWDRRKVKRFLELLQNDSMICTTSGTTDGTTITIVNYSKFQNRGTTDGTTHGTTDGTTDGTKDVQRTVQSMYINNNYNNINNDNNVEQNAPPKTTFTPYKGGYGGPNRKTAFHNIEQHDYDFEALEQELLERGRKKLNE